MASLTPGLKSRPTKRKRPQQPKVPEASARLVLSKVEGHPHDVRARRPLYWQIGRSFPTRRLRRRRDLPQISGAAAFTF